jgi:haloalkane dehalogenase
MTYARATELPPDVRVEYPFNSYTHVVEKGVSMHYVDEGQGPVVVLLHGNPTWSFYYRNLIRELSGRGFRCIAPDHVGCGLSDKPRDYPYTLERRISDVASLLDSLSLDAFHLVGHDWGGAIACGLATERVADMGKMVLANTGAFRSQRIPLRIAAIKVPVLGECIIRGLNGFARPAATMAAKVPLKPAVRRGLLWPYRSWDDRVAVWNFVKDIPLRSAHPSYGRLAEVEAGLPKLSEKPIQLVWGERDFCFTRHFHDRFREIFPNAQSVLFPAAGHYVLEDAGPPSWEAIGRFLSA